MKIGICTIGSRGDIQPFLALGNALAARGHEVRLTTAGMYASLASRYDVEFAPFNGDYAALVDSEEAKKAIGGNPFTMRKRLTALLHPLVVNSLEKYLETARWADVLVYHPKTLADAFGSLFPHKLIKAYVVPAFTPTRDFPSPLFSGVPLPVCCNRLSYRLSRALVATVRQPLRTFFVRHGLPETFRFLDVPAIYGVSPHFVPCPVDYPEHHHFTGFWFEAPAETSLPPQVHSFTDSGKKILVITFGSMPYKSPTDINHFLEALLRCLGIRIILVRGWGLQKTRLLDHPDLLALDYVPFSRLFPKADAIVHHGGAGTTALALRAGRPMLICPVLHPAGDQMFWGKMACRQGVGVPPLPLKSMRVREFVRAVHSLLDKDFSGRCAAMQRNILAEDGLTAASQIIENHVQQNSP